MRCCSHMSRRRRLPFANSDKLPRLQATISGSNKEKNGLYERLRTLQRYHRFKSPKTPLLRGAASLAIGEGAAPIVQTSIEAGATQGRRSGQEGCQQESVEFVGCVADQATARFRQCFLYASRTWRICDATRHVYVRHETRNADFVPSPRMARNVRWPGGQLQFIPK